jgi:hypothetical protein
MVRRSGSIWIFMLWVYASSLSRPTDPDQSRPLRQTVPAGQRTGQVIFAPMLLCARTIAASPLISF